MNFSGYIGRFAPSPSGPLHAGSLVAAMASFLDARAHTGAWLLRIEDVDEPRCQSGSDKIIMQQLQALGMHWDGEPVWQSQHYHLYQAALLELNRMGRVYPCRCSRRQLLPGPYPGTCRQNTVADINNTDGQHLAWRFVVKPGLDNFIDRWAGPQSADVAAEVGDFIIKRADGYWAYQLAVVVDDAAQGISHIVRGADLLDCTARQRQLALALGYTYPSVMHVPLLCDKTGRKLSKQNHAQALDTDNPLDCLVQAWCYLGFNTFAATDIRDFWSRAIQIWATKYLNTQ